MNNEVKAEGVECVLLCFVVRFRCSFCILLSSSDDFSSNHRVHHLCDRSHCNRSVTCTSPSGVTLFTIVITNIISITIKMIITLIIINRCKWISVCELNAFVGRGWTEVNNCVYTDVKVITLHGDSRQPNPSLFLSEVCVLSIQKARQHPLLWRPVELQCYLSPFLHLRKDPYQSNSEHFIRYGEQVNNSWSFWFNCCLESR